jgi:hypothetical protein
MASKASSAQPQRRRQQRPPLSRCGLPYQLDGPNRHEPGLYGAGRNCQFPISATQLAIFFLDTSPAFDNVFTSLAAILG